MIICRFVEDAQNQNWLGVIVDLLVVVLGIFLGLQAADWNQTRLDRQEANYHLNFLYEELGHDIEAGEAEVSRRIETLDKSFTAVMLMTKDSWNEEEEAVFK
jgi:hypothetical protein